jgi:cell division protein FtsZ
MEEEIIKNDELLGFDFQKETAANIKVVGVGGGGGNAVSHMFNEGINSVNFVLCNTDSKALNAKPVPNKLILGPKLLGGRGTGNDPQKAIAATAESEAEVRKLFSDGTEMVFITAGMGGGTGTGAAPVIAGIAKEMGMLTVGIVTIPYLFERGKKIMQALEGVENMGKNVDALIVINNEKLFDMYPDETLFDEWKKADDTLLIAAKSIADIITKDDYMNDDLNDVRTTLKDSGIAVISYGIAEGEHRVSKAIESAIHSPLLNNSNVYQAKRILFVIYCSTTNPVRGREMKEDIYPFMQKFSDEIDVIYGIGVDESLGDSVKVTVLASGFSLDNLPEMQEKHRREYENLTEDERDEIDRKKREDAAVKEHQKLLIVRHYGADKLDEIVGNKTPEPYIFKFDELDNDEVIEKVLITPTYLRK